MFNSFLFQLKDMVLNKILILDFGSQYTHLLARRIRQLGVYSEICSPSVSTKTLSLAKGIILSGGPNSVYEKNAPKFNKNVFRLNKPVLGLCYGLQLMVHELGGTVEQGKVKEYGKAELVLKEKGGLFLNTPEKQVVWMSHGDKASVLPSGFRVAGETENCPLTAIENPEKNFFGLQFHPEVTHTASGMQVLSNFLFQVCKCEKEWSIKNFLEHELEKLKKTVGNKKVFLLVSGGIDSTVAAAMLSKIIPKEHLFFLHVDSGFMRKNESENVKKVLEPMGVKVHVLNASERFFNALENTFDPEEKRTIIGELFVRIAEEELERVAGKNTDEWLIAQGTIYPDTIETGGTKHADKIKTHHNRVPLMQELIKKGRVIEPLSQLYKDEVRELGEMLGVSQKIIHRHPFPGPGLAIRVLCSEKNEKNFSMLETRINDFVNEKSYTAKVLPVKAVGVQGDNRTYRYAVCLSGNPDYEELERLSTLIANSFSEINRVVYALEPKNIETAESIAGQLTRERTDLLREADAVVNDFIAKKDLEKEIWQFPVVLLNIEVNEQKGNAIVLRPVVSKEAMTANFAWINQKTLFELSKKILELKKINAVFLDVTNKPPATIEWE
jgi:GMP synthase (glutamine-hydrolysing)